MAKYVLKIKELAKKKGITRAYLAKKTGASINTVSSWYQKTSVPRIETLFELAKIFECSIEDLFEKVDEGS